MYTIQHKYLNADDSWKDLLLEQNKTFFTDVYEAIDYAYENELVSDFTFQKFRVLDSKTKQYIIID